MECDQKFCIYNEKSVCLLDEQSINAAGMCESCITITMEEGILHHLKNQTRQSLGEYF